MIAYEHYAFEHLGRPTDADYLKRLDQLSTERWRVVGVTSTFSEGYRSWLTWTVLRRRDA